LLQADPLSVTRSPINPERSESLFMLATALNQKLVGYRRAYQQQASRVVNLRQQLLQARTRRDKSRDRHLAAINEFRKLLEEKERIEMADLYAGRLHGRALTVGQNAPSVEKKL
jgi:septal ring factor EnvC (AmiA/AmiB activator)